MGLDGDDAGGGVPSDREAGEALGRELAGRLLSAGAGEMLG